MNIERSRVRASAKSIFGSNRPSLPPDQQRAVSSRRRSSLEQSLQCASSSKTALDFNEAIIETDNMYNMKAPPALSRQARPKRAAATKKTRKDADSKVPSPRSPTMQKKWSFRSSTTSKQCKRYDEYVVTAADQDDSHTGRIAFPVRLFDMLSEIEWRGQTSVVSWLSHGRALRVHDPDAFVTKVLPLYFKQSKITSFQRQLNVYGFRRIVFGRDAGAYHHKFFLKGARDLAFRITRVGIKNTGVRSTYLFQEEEPDFYSMPPIDLSSLSSLDDESHPSSPVGSQPVEISSEPALLLVRHVAPPPLYSCDKPLLERLVDMQLDCADDDGDKEEVMGEREFMAQGGDSLTATRVSGCTCCLLPTGERGSNERGKGGRCCGCQLTHSVGDRIFFEGESFYYMDSVLHDDAKS